MTLIRKVYLSSIQRPYESYSLKNPYLSIVAGPASTSLRVRGRLSGKWDPVVALDNSALFSRACCLTLHELCPRLPLRIRIVVGETFTGGPDCRFPRVAHTSLILYVVGTYAGLCLKTVALDPLLTNRGISATSLVTMVVIRPVAV